MSALMVVPTSQVGPKLVETNPVARRTQEFFRAICVDVASRSPATAKRSIRPSEHSSGGSREPGWRRRSRANRRSHSRTRRQTAGPACGPMAERFQLAGGLIGASRSDADWLKGDS
jgi:hypothetical protein